MGRLFFNSIYMCLQPRKIGVFRQKVTLAKLIVVSKIWMLNYGKTKLVEQTKKQSIIMAVDMSYI